MLSGAPGSRGVPEVWPHVQPKFAESIFANQRNYFDNTSFLEQPRWANLNWTTGPNGRNSGAMPAGKYNEPNVCTTKGRHRYEAMFVQLRGAIENAAPVSQRFNSDGSRRQRGKKKNPNRKRGGVQKRRCNPNKEKRAPQVLNIFFGNTTFAIEKAKIYLLERDDDVVMLAESHQNKMKTLQLIKFFEWNKWKATASPARPT